MNRDVSQSQTKAKAALFALVHLAAIGCGSERDASAGGAPSAGAAAAVLALEQKQAPTVYSALPPSDPIVRITHGAIYTTDRGVIKATPEFVREVQLGYLERLSGEASPEVLQEFEAIRAQREPQVGAPTEFADRAFLISWLIERVQPSDAAKLSSRNKFLKQAMDPSCAPAFPEGIPDVLRKQREAYKAACLDAGVPTPPDWSPNAPEWTSAGTLNPDFIGKGTVGTVYYYISDDPRGLCMALPRANADTKIIELLGVICQGNNTSSACFWDNDGCFTPGQSTTMTDNFESAEELVDGDDRCTDCHRGENIFIAHPNSPLDIDIRAHGAGWVFDRSTSYLQALDYVKPIVYGDWENKLADTFPEVTGDETSCITCHQAGEVGGRLGALDNASYCEVMWHALSDTDHNKRTMPFSSPLTEGKTYPQAHYDFVKNACRAMTEPFGMFWD